MATYSASSLIDKTLYAAARVPLYRVASDGSAPFAYVQPGKMVGVVYSYLNVKPGVRSSLFWMFYDGNGVAYYAPMAEGLYNLSAVRDQGVISTKEAIALQKQKEESAGDYFKKLGKVLVFGGLGVAALAMFLKYRKN